MPRRQPKRQTCAVLVRRMSPGRKQSKSEGLMPAKGNKTSEQLLRLCSMLHWHDYKLTCVMQKHMNVFELQVLQVKKTSKNLTNNGPAHEFVLARHFV